MRQCIPSTSPLRSYQKTISKSLIWSYLSVNGLYATLCSAVPYCGGAHGLNIWSGLPPRIARGTAPWTPGRCKKGGGVGIALTGFCGPIGASICAEAVTISAAMVAIIINVFMFFLSCAGVQVLARHNACPHYILRWTTLKRPHVFWI